MQVLFAPQGHLGFFVQLYVSTTTFVTLGLGDLTPLSPLGRFLTGIEAIAGFGFLALTIAYLPVLYQAFSRREVRISMLDQWAGSPPTSTELLRRSATKGNLSSVDHLLGDWERWASELLESHLSYPVLAYFRSQHEQESWLAALTAVLDTCSLVLAGVDGVSGWQAWRTFAISRHAVVDLAEVLRVEPRLPPDDRHQAGRRGDATARAASPQVRAVRLRAVAARPDAAPVVPAEPGRDRRLGTFRLDAADLGERVHQFTYPSTVPSSRTLASSGFMPASLRARR
jgi:hypothetical protein